MIEICLVFYNFKLSEESNGLPLGIRNFRLAQEVKFTQIFVPKHWLEHNPTNCLCFQEKSWSNPFCSWPYTRVWMGILGCQLSVNCFLVIAQLRVDFQISDLISQLTFSNSLIMHQVWTKEIMTFTVFGHLISRAYGTLKFGDVREKFNFLERQDLIPLRTFQNDLSEFSFRWVWNLRKIHSGISFFT